MLHQLEFYIFIVSRGPILESQGMCAIFQKTSKKKGKNNNNNNNNKKGQNIWKYGRTCTKFGNILKKGGWLCVIITRNKLREKALI